MSRTTRRNHFNRQHHIYEHYWEQFSDAEAQKYSPLWKYHSDNYHTKKSCGMKQFWKNQEYRKLRRDFKNDIAASWDNIGFYDKPRSMKWRLH